MLDKNKVQEALNRIDSLLSKARIADPVLSRLDHIQLVQDMRLLNECCMEYFDDEQELKETRIVRLENERTDQQPVDATVINEDSEGSGDSVSGD